MLKGERVTLRALRRSDTDTLYGYWSGLDVATRASNRRIWHSCHSTEAPPPASPVSVSQRARMLGEADN